MVASTDTLGKGDAQFLKGVAISVWQNSSDTDSNWATFAKARKYFGQKDLVDTFLESNDFWNKYEEDIAMAKAVGSNSFRLSLEWARFEPKRGQWDDTAVQRYHQIFDCLERLQMEPMVTLHHFTHPQWFEDLGGFEKEENIPIFVEYAKRVFSLFGHRVRLWSTFNEPTCFAFCGYICGLWAPGKTAQMEKCGVVLWHLLSSHVQVYKALKTMPGGQAAQIGMVHQHIRFVSQNNWSQVYTKGLTEWMTFWFGTGVMLEFFRTGRFEWRAPLRGVVMRRQCDDAPSTVDWWGINYYTRIAVNWAFQTGGVDSSERVSDMQFPIVPEDLYFHIKEAASLGHPIYITETGLADARDEHRAHLIRTYYAQILRAIRDGYNVRGVFYWTLMDNIEWHNGFRMKFGLYEFCPVERRNKQLRLRDGAKALIDIHKQWPDTVSALREYASTHAEPSALAVVSSTDDDGAAKVAALINKANAKAATRQADDAADKLSMEMTPTSVCAVAASE